MQSNSLPSTTSLGAVHLTVSNLARSLEYYQMGIGLVHYRTEDGTAHLGCGGRDLLHLTEKKGAQIAHRVSGLYHFALLVPSRRELARTLRHLVDAGTPMSGSADHAVSEAIYLSDPDGHGIELYRDRPRAEWQYQGEALRITTEPLDVHGVLAELRGFEREWNGLHSETILGHIHLHVADLASSEDFYVKVMGFDLVARYGPSASFVSAGGYHHHIGMNMWAGRNVPPPPDEALQLQWFSLQLPDSASVAQLIRNLEAVGTPVAEGEGGLIFRDPSANQILIATNNPLGKD